MEQARPRVDARRETQDAGRLGAADVKAEARRLGFTLVGIATAEPFVQAEERLIRWVRQDRHGEMAWIDEARARRSCHPDELLSGARSIIAVGAAYSAGGEADPPPLHGRVVRYARGHDYHDLLKARLWELVGFLRARSGRAVRARVFVDDGPLADREAAVRAGLGFYGKNTCLIAPGVGSYVLLGAILTDLPLDPDRPVLRDCGSCRLCLDACPTGALLSPYQLDARLCISYLTIELRGPIPPELRPQLGAHVFGCDICQEVCPWNHGRGPLPWPEFDGLSAVSCPPLPTADPPQAGSRRRPAGVQPTRLRRVAEGAPQGYSGAAPDLLELLALDDEGFRRRFRGSPVKRAKRRGLLRNAAVALGNRGDRRAVPALTRALLHEPEPLVRSHAAWALQQLGGPEAEAALAAAWEREADPSVRDEILGASGRTARQPDTSTRSE